eukprot:6296350-Prymnesium_polylepis.2
MATAPKASDGQLRVKYGYDLPLLNAGLVDVGEISGTSDAAATCAAIIEALEHPAPTIALTPLPLKASRVRCSAPAKLAVGSHLESR